MSPPSGSSRAGRTGRSSRKRAVPGTYPRRLAGPGRELLSCAPVDEVSKLIPLRRRDGAGEPVTFPSSTEDAEDAEPAPRQPEAPWRLAVVEAWFARARQAGLDTIEERRRARLGAERGPPPAPPDK